MRATVYTENGDSSVLRLIDRPVPEPRSGEVRVRLVRAGVNPTDYKLREGTSGTLAFDEITPGQDGAGVVDAVGDGVSGLATGDDVWLYLAQDGRPYGTAAEYVVLPADRAVRLTRGGDGDAAYDMGASLGVPAITAHLALTSGDVTSRLGPGAMIGQTVLVQGGAGAVGNAAIQLARWSGAKVITTVSSDEKAALATAAGADACVNYRKGDPIAEIKDLAPDGVDLVVEVAPVVNNDLDRAVIRQRATIAIFANNGGDQLTLRLRETFSRNPRYQFIMLYTVGADAHVRAVNDITAAVAAGALGVGEEAGLPLHHFRLEQTAAAHDAAAAGVVGKVLIDL